MSSGGSEDEAAAADAAVDPPSPSSPRPADDDDGPPVDDEDLIRILVSTDNHLGYAERDPVRGLDSFAAFEEVLHLARKHKCDMVLIAGDLFHDNKPSRRTLHKTMEIIRRYSMGPHAVRIQIVSDQATNFRSAYGTVNYEDEFYSVDLPIFSIHGNHDDPTREGGTEMLAALDLLAVSNLVNYFGRQDEVDRVEVSPILIEKGETKIALYGMGSMRDERLNRMWRGKKVRFMRPSEEDWFHIFALHQNRDLGRGTKNCVHESMIPEWMDLVVWGHEHECLIEPTESVVGTFRITQPGSSVATSLTGGEAVRKQVGLLDIKYNQFRLKPIPLTQVRSFVMGELSLQDQSRVLDPEDPKIDAKVTKILEDEVRMLKHEARDKYQNLLRDAAESGNTADTDKLKYKLEKPDEVLVRLKVEHSGFSTLNNQRFGAKFVGDVANPSDVLLFHRRKEPSGKKATRKNPKLANPIAPEELEEMNIEVLVKENLDASDKKLEILNEQRLGFACEQFVEKQENKAFNEAMKDSLGKQQKKLIKRGADAATKDGEGEDSKIYSAADVREVVHQESSQRQHQEEAKRQRKDEDSSQATSNKASKAKPKGRKRSSSSFDEDEDEDDDDDDDDEIATSATKSKTEAKGRKRSSSALDDSDYDEDVSVDKENGRNEVTHARRKKATTKSTGRGASKKNTTIDILSDSDDDMVMEPPPKKKSTLPVSRPRRQARNSTKKYNVDDSDDDFESEDVIEIGSDNDSASDVEIVQTKKSSKPSCTSRQAKGKKSQRSSKRTARGSSQRSRRAYDSSDEDIPGGSAYGLDDDWGTTNTESARY